MLFRSSGNRITGLPRNIKAGYGGSSPSSSSSNDDSDKKDFPDCVTPEKRKKLKKYKKKEYSEKDGVQFMKDQLDPEYQHGELTDDDKKENKLEYEKADGFRLSYLFNIPYKDKYNLKFESLMEPKYIERLHLEEKNLMKAIKNDKYLSKYKKVILKYEDIGNYPASKMMSLIRSAIGRNSSKDNVTDNYLVDFFYGSKSRIFLLNQIVGPNILDANNYLKYMLNIRLLELNKKIKQFKKLKKKYHKIYDDYAKSTDVNQNLYSSLELLQEMLTYLLFDINMMITQMEYDMKLNYKLDLSLKAHHLVMMKGAGKLQKETDKYIKKHNKDKVELFSLVDEVKPTTLLSKVFEQQQTQIQQQSENHAYMNNEPKIKFDEQLGRVKGKIFGENKNKNNNHNNSNSNNSNYNNNNKNYNNNHNNNRNNNRNNYRGKNNRNKNNYNRNNNNNNRNYNNYNNNNNYNNRNNFNNRNNQQYNNQQNYYNQNNNNNNNNFQNQNHQQQQQGRFPQRYDNRNFDRLNNNNFQQQKN